jgi:prepilin-type N-terminal cleavage/methylation domain-containing protein
LDKNRQNRTPENPEPESFFNYEAKYLNTKWLTMIKKCPGMLGWQEKCLKIRRIEIQVSSVWEGGQMRKGSRGFSLIELLIVVAIILIIAAIAIPNLLRSRIAANQASAVGSLRTLNTAEVTYASTYNTGYTSTLGDLMPPASGTNPVATAAGLIDSVLSGGASTATTSSKSGYTFTYTPGATDVTGRYNTYGITATPISVGTTGTNYYFTDQSGVIRQNSTAVAGASDSPLAG